MFRFSLILFVVLVGTMSAEEEKTTQDNIKDQMSIISNTSAFLICSIILIIIINVAGFVFMIGKFFFVQSELNKVKQHINELNNVTGEEIAHLGGRIRVLTENIKDNFVNIAKSLKEFAIVVRPALARKRDTATDPVVPYGWVDLELGTQGSPTGEGSLDLEQEPFYYF